MISIFKKEFRSYMNNVTGSVFIAFLLLFAGLYTTAINLRGGYTSFEYVLSNITIVFLLLAPLLGMRSFAEEKRSKTDQLLYSLPMSVTQIVLGKYFAMLAVFAIPVLIMGLFPVILSLFGVKLGKIHCVRFVFGIVTHAHQLIPCKGYELHLFLRRFTPIKGIRGELGRTEIFA